MQDAALGDLLVLAGQDLPVTGNVNFQAHAGGTLGDLTGGGNLLVQGGVIEGQPYHSLAATLTFSGQDLHLTKLTFLQDGGTVVGNGTYNLKSKAFLGNLDGTNFELAHFPQSKDPRLSVAGAVKFDVHASGTIDAPSVLAGVHLRSLVLGGQPAGGLEVVVHTQGSNAIFTAQSSLAAAQLQVKGQTVQRGDFPTQANIVLSNLNIAPLSPRLQGAECDRRFVDWGAPSTSLARCARRSCSVGMRRSPSFAVTLQGIALKGAGPLRVSLHDEILHLTQAHITGPETDLSVTGTAALTGGSGAGAHRQWRRQYEACPDLRPGHYLVRPHGLSMSMPVEPSPNPRFPAGSASPT